MRELPTKFIPYLFLFLLLAVGCKKDRLTDEEAAMQNNTGIRLEPEIMRLGTFFGDVFSDVVLIHVQSGPAPELKTPELKTLLDKTERDDAFFIFNLHQVQTLHPEKISAAITFEQAKILNQESVDMLAKVIRYFKDQNKKVYVLGITYGAYIAQELILQESATIADKFLLMTGRLDMPEVIWKAMSEGNTAGFINGTTPFTGEPSTLTVSQKNLNKLFAGLSFKRYTKELSVYKELNNITYCLSEIDEEIGAMTQNEKGLLVTRNAKVIELGVSHQKAIEGLLDEGFKVAFEGK